MTLSKMLGFVSHWTGLIYLSAFVMNTGLLWFILRKSFSCSFIDAGVVYVQCGTTAFDKFLDLFLLYFSPLVAPVTAFYWRYLFYNPLAATESQFAFLFIYFPLSVFVMASCLFVLRRMIKGFLLHKKDKARAKASRNMLLIILLPTLISFGYRIYLIPPQWVVKNVQVDIWNGEFNVPREELKDWSMMTLPRPDRKPSEYASRLTRWWKSVPYLTFNYSLKEGIGEKIIEVGVNPHYDVLNRENMEAARQKLAGYKTRLLSEFDQSAVYRKTPRVQGRWEIYDAGTYAEDVFPDIYVARNQDNTISHILQCTPSNACAVKTRFRWTSYPCGEDMPCDSCRKICTDISLGTSDYDIRYSFYKEDLDEYFEFDDDIRNYVASFYTPRSQLKK